VVRDLVGVVLAAGKGERLRPLTEVRPKALCPINNTPLLDLALARVRRHVVEVAVNTHHLAHQVQAHLEGTGVMVSVEAPDALGTAGALGALRHWIAGRDVLIHNADAWLTDPLDQLVGGWDGRRARLLVGPADDGRPDFGDRRFVGVSLLPGTTAASLPRCPQGLYEAVWKKAWESDQLELVDVIGPAVDCGTIAEYLRANLIANGGASVIGPGCVVNGQLRRSVIWEGCTVELGECLTDTVRATASLTVGA
jgi:N-acetyl-alpha-D-muramate 1-phosphate uridylyltransferase